MDMSAHSELVESLKRDVIEVLNLEEITMLRSLARGWGWIR